MAKISNPAPKAKSKRPARADKEFVIARQAVKPTRVTMRQIRDAVRKVKKEMASEKS